MSNRIQNSLDGIAGDGIKSTSLIEPFSGEEPSKFFKFITQLTTALSAKGIPLPVQGSNWLETEQVKFATKSSELIPIVFLTAIQMAKGYQIGDLALSAAHRQAYEKELEINKLKKAHAVALLNQYIVPSSEAFNVINEGSILNDFEKMYWDLNETYRGARLSVLIVHIEKYVDIITSSKMLKLVELQNAAAQSKRAFSEILGLFNSEYDDDKIAKEGVKIFQLWTTLVDIVAFSRTSSERVNIKDFIQRYVRENTSKPLQIDLSLLLTQLKTFCESAKHDVKPLLKDLKDNGDKVPVAKAYYTQLVSESKKYNALKRTSENLSKDKDDVKCTFCGKLKHTA